MKVIVDVPHEIICQRYLGANDQVWLVHAVKNGKPLFEALNEIKGEMEDLAEEYKECKYANTYISLCMKVIDKHIENNC